MTQYDAYLPYGELLVDEHSSSADLPYKFNGKELDEETGLYYYGARYMNPVTSMWYGVDPLAEKYANVSAFVYCMGNPVKLVDPDGAKILPWYLSKLNTSHSAFIVDEYRSHVWTIRAMKEIGKTKYGNAFISSFLEKGTHQYGVHGNGKYSKYTLNIRSYYLNDPTLAEQMLSNSDGSFAAGSFKPTIDENGDLVFRLSLRLDAIASVAETIETIAHEIGLHGAKIDAFIQVYEKEGYDAAMKKVWRASSEAKEHKDLKNGNTSNMGVQNYKSMQNELESNVPNTKQAFQEAAKLYDSEY